MQSAAQLREAASAAGYSPETFEKVLTLLRLLEGIKAHPLLGERLALKGGTALNLFVMPLTRLSVDIDLNYVGRPDREGMLEERPLVDRALSQVFERAGLTVRNMPSEHAGGKWRLSYTSALGRSGTVEVDINFLLRSPLWPPVRRDSHPLAGQQTQGVLVLEESELAAGKLAALVARSASRDLFDARELLRAGTFDPAQLRLAFVAYGGINRLDWRTVGLDQVLTTPSDVIAQLLPMLRTDLRPTKQQVKAWTASLVEETRQLMDAVLPLHDNERQFLDRLNGQGVLEPQLLTEDSAMKLRLENHPGLLWKAQNVRQHRGL